MDRIWTMTLLRKKTFQVVLLIVGCLFVVLFANQYRLLPH